MRPLILLAALLPCLALAAEPIYKTHAADGTPVFTDQPGDAPAEPVTLSPGNDYSPPPTSDVQVPTDRSAASAATSYQVTISSPQDNASIRDNAGDLTIVGAVQPALADGDRFRLLLDGRDMGTNRDGAFALSSLDRGEHHARIQVIDADGKVLASSKPVTLYLLRHHIGGS